MLPGALQALELCWKPRPTLGHGGSVPRSSQGTHATTRHHLGHCSSGPPHPRLRTPPQKKLPSEVCCCGRSQLLTGGRQRAGSPCRGLAPPQREKGRLCEGRAVEGVLGLQWAQAAEGTFPAGGSLARSSSSPQQLGSQAGWGAQQPVLQLAQTRAQGLWDTACEWPASGSTEPWRTGRENLWPVKRSWRWGPRGQLPSQVCRGEKEDSPASPISIGLPHPPGSQPHRS